MAKAVEWRAVAKEKAFCRCRADSLCAGAVAGYGCLRRRKNCLSGVAGRVTLVLVALVVYGAVTTGQEALPLARRLVCSKTQASGVSGQETVTVLLPTATETRGCTAGTVVV